jgi:TPP-dependent indolepyruvate ferredoxin oxidoreductase alpha subunit
MTRPSGGTLAGALLSVALDGVAVAMTGYQPAPARLRRRAGPGCHARSARPLRRRARNVAATNTIRATTKVIAVNPDTRLAITVEWFRAADATSAA